MGKKHGFRGTPVRPNPQPGSMSGSFAKRGNPLVSEREGIKDFGRNIETENPDYDRYFTKLAVDLLRPEQIDRTNEGKKRNALLSGRKATADAQTKATNNMLATRRKVAEAIRKSEGIQSEAQRRMFKEPRDEELVWPDNIPATVPETSTDPSREKQTPVEVRNHEGFYDFSGKLPPKEIKKHGKVYRRK